MHGIMRSRVALYSTAAFFSILLSTWAALKTSVINPDAICYLYSAEAVAKGLSFAAHLCPQAKWPFYSILLSGLARFTHLSYTVTAYCLDGFFSLISVITFIAIIDSLTYRTRMIALAACVILLAHEFNGLRVEIIRDHGFWAFYLLSLLFALRYFVHSRKHIYSALLWSSSLILATLFRIEGAVFLILLPFAVWIDTRETLRSRIKSFLQLNLLTILGCVVLLVWMMTHPQSQLGRLTEIQFQIIHGLSELAHSFQQTAHALASHVLSVYSARDTNWLLILMLTAWYAVSVISNVSPIYAILITYAWCKKLAKITCENRLVLWSYILINVLITLIFLVDNLFLAKRYLIALSLVLMLWVPFALDNLLTQWRQRKWPLLLAGLLIILYGASGIFDFGHSKKYIRDGGDWLALHATPQQKIYSNDYQLLYYANHMGNLIFSEGIAFENLNTIADNKWQQYDYVALRVNQQELKNNIPLLQEIPFTPVAIFQNDRGDQVRIYEIHRRIR